MINLKFKSLFFLVLSLNYCCSNGKTNSQIDSVFTYDLSQNLISINEGIDKISYTEIKSEKTISFRDDGFQIIKSHGNKIYASNRNEDELYIIDTSGIIKKTIFTNKKDVTGPRIIRDFTITKENLIIYQKYKNLFYLYNLSGDFVTTKRNPDTLFDINAISFLKPNHLILQKYHDNLNASFKRNNTLIGKVLDLKTFNTTRSIYYPGGSESRDKIVNLRFIEHEEGNLYNYYLSSELFEITKNTEKIIFKLESKDLISEETLEKIDNSPPFKATEIWNNEIRNNNKIDNLLFYYKYKNIYFMRCFWRGNMHWIFYNSTKDQYKVMKFKPMTAYIHSGVSFYPSIKNAKENYFMIMLDGQSMQDTEKIKFDKNKAYYIKIYPKYLNQEAWE